MAQAVHAIAASRLKKGLVVTADTVPITGKKLVLDLPSVGYEVSFSTADVREMPAEQFAAFATEFRNRFAEPFALARRKWLADLRKVVRLAEGEVRSAGKYADGTPEAVREMHVIVDRANSDLRAKCAACTEALRQMGDLAYRAALQDSYRAVQRPPAASGVRVSAEFELVKPIPPARPIIAVSRLVTLPTARLR